MIEFQLFFVYMFTVLDKFSNFSKLETFLSNKINGFLVLKNSIEPNWKILFKTKTKPEPNNFLNSDPNPNQTRPKPNQTQKNWN